MQGLSVARKTRRREIAPPVLEGGPTPQRLAMAQGFVEVGGDDRSAVKLTTMRDSPIERALARKVISDRQYTAATKYRLHWYRAGLAGSLQSLDMDRVFASDPASDGAGMCRSDIEYFHREQYRKAAEHVGGFGRIVLDLIVCAEHPLEDAGYRLGWGARPAAIVAATERLRAALDDLVKHWGL